MSCDKNCLSCKNKVVTTLDHVKLNKKVLITKVNGERKLRKRLLEMGLIPKTFVIIEKTAPLGDPLDLLVRGYHLSIRKSDAKNIEVCVYE